MILPRRPHSGNPYYNARPNGYSTCILGNYPRNAKKKTGYPGLTNLPNCVGFAVGYLNESNGCEDFSLLGSYQAFYLIEVAKQRGMKVTQEPTLGGLMCWSKNGGAGHVCVVQEIKHDSTVKTAESEWNGVVYAEYIRRKGDGNWRSGCYWMGDDYRYLGCIANPALEEEMRYNTIEELPAYARKTVMDLCDADIIKGSGEHYDKDGYPTDLDLSLDMVRILVWNDRAGLYKYL